MKQPLLVQVYRGQHVESQHQVLACAVDYKGQVLQSFGDSSMPVYLRSAAKPFQALAFLESGAATACEATTQEIALACASHLGHAKHVQIVTNLLARSEINVQALHNCEHEHNSETAFSCQKNHKDEKKLLEHNCSGKHAAFLVTQKHLGGDLQNYLEPSGQLQKTILQSISDLAHVPLVDLAKTVEPDGCGAPIFQMPLQNIARLYAELGAWQHSSHGPALKTIFQAMQQNPDCVRGEGDFNTDLIRAFDGRLVAKLGYEGVYGIALANGVGVAVKVLDGNARALSPVILHILKILFSNTDSAFASLQKWAEPVVNNIHKVGVGHISVMSAGEKL